MGAIPILSAGELPARISEQHGHLVVRYPAFADALPFLIAATGALTPEARVLCANECTVERLRAAGVEHAQTIQDAALEVISDKRVSRAIGRRARVLDANELDILMEDLKVTGIKGGRLREMFKFFCKSLSEGVPDDPTWLVNAEESKQYAILEENLEARQALLPSEVCYRALQGLRAVPEARETAPVVIEDFGAMGKCAQQLALTLADDVCVAFVRDGDAASSEEPYPHHAGVAESLGTGFGQGRLALDEPRPDRTVQGCGRPADEFTFAAARVAELLDAGTRPNEMLVAVPNALWGRRIAEQLAARGIPAFLDFGPHKVKGDPRYPEKAGQIRLVALARLSCDPDDFTALRTWVGAGDWLVRSDAFLELLAYAREHGMRAFEAARRLHGTEKAGELQAFYKIDEELSSLDAIREADDDPAMLAAALADAGIALDGAQAAALSEGGLTTLAALVLDDEAPQPSPGAVRIATYPRCHALVARHVIATGLVDGFLPAPDAIDDSHTIDHKASALARERRLFDDLVARASETLTLTYFTEDRMENTEKLPMQVQRIRVRHGARYAQLARSQFIAE